MKINSLAKHPLHILIPARLAKGSHTCEELYKVFEWFDYPDWEYKEVISTLIHEHKIEMTPDRKLQLFPTTKGTWYIGGSAYQAIRDFVLYLVRERITPPSMRDLWESFSKALSPDGARDAIAVTWQLLANQELVFDEHRKLLLGAPSCITAANVSALATPASSSTSFHAAKTNPDLNFSPQLSR